MAPAIDLRPDHRKTVEDILRDRLPDGVQVWAFGSRADWTSKDSSDLDLALEGAGPLDTGMVMALELAFEDSLLPFRVDVVDLLSVNEGFRRRVMAGRTRLLLGGGADLLVDTDDLTHHRQAAAKCRDSRAWQRMTIGHCATLNPQTSVPDTRAYIQYLDTANLTRNRIEHLQHLVPGRDTIPSRARRTAQDGDVLYSTVRPNQRHFGILKEVPEHFVASTGFSVIRGRRGIADTSFLYCFLTQDAVVDQLQTIAEHSTSAYPSIRPIDIESLVVHLPELREQRAIARVLGALDDRIELNRRMNQTLEAMARALFKSWFVDFDPVRAKMEGRDPGLPSEIADLFPDQLVDSELGEIPAGWKVGALDHVAVLNPEVWNSTEPPATIRYVDLKNTKWGVMGDVPCHRWQEAPSRARRVLRKGDTVVGTVRPGNGSYALIDEDGLTGSTGFAVLRPREPHNRELAWCAATSSENVSRLALLADGGAYPAISGDAVAATPVVLADAPVRREFCAAVGPLLDEVGANRRSSRRLAELRDALLPALVSGEVRLPAEVLDRYGSSESATRA